MTTDRKPLTSTTLDEIRFLVAVAEDRAPASPESFIAEGEDGLVVALDPGTILDLLDNYGPLGEPVDVARPEWLRGTETVLVLRGCNEKFESRNGFKWGPRGTVVEAADFRPSKQCGEGLHGYLNGEGNPKDSLPPYALLDDAKWLVFEARKDELVDLAGKCKVKRALVVFDGTQDEAVAEMQRRAPGAAVIYGKATAGNYGKATAGNSGQATAGNSGQATAGNSGQATAGNYGKATAGYNGQATAGNYGQATAGNYGQATAGYNGIIVVSYYDEAAKRTRLVVGYPGEDGIKPGVEYKLVDRKFVEANPLPIAGTVVIGVDVNVAKEAA